MAEEDAEIALLHQMQAGQDSVAWEGDGAEQVADGGPSNTEHKKEHVKRENVADDQVLRALSPSAAGRISGDGQYNPCSVTSIPAVTLAGQGVSRSSSRASSRKPKTVGGFIADDSDEESDSSTSEQASTGLQVPTSNTPNRTISLSPLQAFTSQEDMQTPPENQDDLKPDVQASYSPVNPSFAGAPSVSASAAQVLTSAAPSALPKARLPHDRTGILEDRIKEDPRGDLDAWMSLISEHRGRNKLDDARTVYERFLKVFPQAAEIWVAYTEMELDNDNFAAAENIFSRSLMTVPNVGLWSVYLNYIRRRNDLTNDASGAARATISQSYEFVLSNIGIDKDSGRIWQDYIHFVKSAPGQIGGNSWQDQQKMDQVRKAYQRSVTVPMSNVNGLWKEYDNFEMNLNKMFGRKFLQEKSPAYMSARSANTALENITRGLSRSTLPKLAPALGFDGDQEYLQQVELWKKWIFWEQDDPLALKTDEFDEYKKRVLYVYKQAVMSLRFWPEMWLDAAEWCYTNGMETDGDTFLNNGIGANPESCLLAFKKADRLESNLATEVADKGPAERGAIVRSPFDKLLDNLYDLIKQLKARETRDIAKLEEALALDASISAIISKAEDDDEENETDRKAREAAKADQTKAIQQGYTSQTQLLQRTISFAWIALMRAMRRVQGKGAVKDAIGGSRQIFADARTRGKITSDVYVASALIEHHVYKDPAGTKIFERGAKLFPEDGIFILEYLKHLLSIGDTTNARVAFETAVSRLTQKQEQISKAKPLYAYFHKYESQYGELSQIAKLEQRMGELFPEDPKLLRFASRYTGETFDPTAVRPIVSPTSQMRPKTLMQSIEKPTSVQNSPRPQYSQVQESSPRPQYLQATNSPKRPFPAEDFETELNRPRKLARGESPLKGAAGRRLNQQKQLQQNQGTPSWQTNASTFVVPRDITFLLSIIPRAELYASTKFNAEAMVRLLGQTIIPDYSTWRSSMEQPQSQAQRYDGMRSSYSPSFTPYQSNNNQAHAGQVSDWLVMSDSGSFQAIAASSCGIGSRPSGLTHERDSFSAFPGSVAPRHHAQSYQGLPPRPEPSRSAYEQPDFRNLPPRPESSGGAKKKRKNLASAVEGPYLLPASSWYYDSANGFDSGYNNYSR